MRPRIAACFAIVLCLLIFPRLDASPRAEPDSRCDRVEQNYPNPFCPESDRTRVNFRLEETGHALLQVFAPDTSLVLATLVDGEFTPGWHQVSWQPVGLYDGDYPYRLTLSRDGQVIFTGQRVLTVDCAELPARARSWGFLKGIYR